MDGEWVRGGILETLNDSDKALVGVRVLIVEDDFLVATSLRKSVERMGCTVLGPAPSVDRAIGIVNGEPLDGAILDVNIVGGSSEPIAHALSRRSVPFFFVTGYASPEISSEDLRETLRLRKPVDVDRLHQVIRALFTRHDPQTGG